MIRKNPRQPRFSARLFSLSAIALSLFAFLLFCAPAYAQLSGKGQLTGRIADSNVSTTTQSTGAGDYSMPTLDPGIYTVTVTVNGFEKLVQKNVHINALE